MIVFVTEVLQSNFLDNCFSIGLLLLFDLVKQKRIPMQGGKERFVHARWAACFQHKVEWSDFHTRWNGLFPQKVEWSDFHLQWNDRFCPHEVDSLFSTRRGMV